MYVIVSKTESPTNCGKWAEVGMNRRTIKKVQSVVAGHNFAHKFAQSEPYRAQFFTDTTLYKEPFRTDYREGTEAGGCACDPRHN